MCSSGRDGREQSHPTSRGGGPSVIVLPEGAQHLQYNSPLGLYNNMNVQQVVAGHFGGVSNAATNGTSAYVTILSEYYCGTVKLFMYACISLLEIQ